MQENDSIIDDLAIKAGRWLAGIGRLARAFEVPITSILAARIRR